ncbi:hypothetical protein BDA99DRAFT_543918 [Phascolomyces articulosus]|uniref:Uncharacterized protein n=1 Tax=Phascolomyces articulosus TaxID=60185 RepID=A0AAD5P7P5_9FUNG|nr:hypothetical protein BDA99DRAFT_543918 [Phascolomyces articulosus]
MTYHTYHVLVLGWIASNSQDVNGVIFRDIVYERPMYKVYMTDCMKKIYFVIIVKGIYSRMVVTEDIETFHGNFRREACIKCSNKAVLHRHRLIDFVDVLIQRKIISYSLDIGKLINAHQLLRTTNRDAINEKPLLGYILLSTFFSSLIHRLSIPIK